MSSTYRRPTAPFSPTYLRVCVRTCMCACVCVERCLHRLFVPLVVCVDVRKVSGGLERCFCSFSTNYWYLGDSVSVVRSSLPSAPLCRSFGPPTSGPLFTWSVSLRALHGPGRFLVWPGPSDFWFHHSPRQFTEMFLFALEGLRRSRGLRSGRLPRPLCLGSPGTEPLRFMSDSSLSGSGKREWRVSGSPVWTRSHFRPCDWWVFSG